MLRALAIVTLCGCTSSPFFVQGRDLTAAMGSKNRPASKYVRAVDPDGRPFCIELELIEDVFTEEGEYVRLGRKRLIGKLHVERRDFGDPPSLNDGLNRCEHATASSRRAALKRWRAKLRRLRSRRAGQ